LCATARGLRVLNRLAELAPDAHLSVFSFREETWEPPFLDDIRARALELGAQFHEARQVGAERWKPVWDAAPVDLLLAVNWRYIVPQSVYSRARLGAYVFHDSLLPAYAGFSPTVWAMINGEDHTGVTLLTMAEGYDEGDIVGQARVDIGPDDTIADVTGRVTEAYLTLLETHLPALLTGNPSRIAQDRSYATYTCKLLPDDMRIDWTWPTVRIYNLIRAVTAPYPGAYTALDGQRLTVWRAERLPLTRRYVGRVPGRVAEVRPGMGTVVLTGDGALLLTHVQLAGQEPAPADAVLNRISLTLR
jgi:methionyl-tRNA formyltransferase